MPMKTAYEIQLEELVVQQRKQVQALKTTLHDREQKFALVIKDEDKLY